MPLSLAQQRRNYTLYGLRDDGEQDNPLVCCVPGSPGACRTAWDQILVGQLDSRTGPCNFVAHLKPQFEQTLSACEAQS
jgi:molybdenum cofactor biosynthesis protein B